MLCVTEPAYPVGSRQPSPALRSTELLVREREKRITFKGAVKATRAGGGVFANGAYLEIQLLTTFYLCYGSAQLALCLLRFVLS